MTIIRMKAVKDKDGKEIFVESASALERNHDSWEPPVPYATMEEYTSRLQAFLTLQHELFCKSYPHHDFTPSTNLLMTGNPADFGVLEELLKPYFSTLIGRGFTSQSQFDEPLLQKVFGEDWKERAWHQDAPIPKGEICDISQRVPREVFFPEKILFTWTKNSDAGSYHNILLEKTAFSAQELTDVGLAALALHETLDFSSHLYGGRFFLPNPCEDYLDTLILVLGSLAALISEPSKLPNPLKKVSVLGWYPTHLSSERCLRVEMPCESILEEDSNAPHASPVKVSNIAYQQCQHLISAGDKVWCIENPCNRRYAQILSLA